MGRAWGSSARVRVWETVESSIRIHSGLYEFYTKSARQRKPLLSETEMKGHVCNVAAVRTVNRPKPPTPNTPHPRIRVDSPPSPAPRLPYPISRKCGAWSWPLARKSKPQESELQSFYERRSERPSYRARGGPNWSSRWSLNTAMLEI